MANPITINSGTSISKLYQQISKFKDEQSIRIDVRRTIDAPFSKSVSISGVANETGPVSFADEQKNLSKLVDKLNLDPSAKQHLKQAFASAASAGRAETVGALKNILHRYLPGAQDPTGYVKGLIDRSGAELSSGDHEYLSNDRRLEVPVKTTSGPRPDRLPSVARGAFSNEASVKLGKDSCPVVVFYKNEAGEDRVLMIANEDGVNTKLDAQALDLLAMKFGQVVMDGLTGKENNFRITNIVIGMNKTTNITPESRARFAMWSEQFEKADTTVDFIRYDNQQHGWWLSADPSTKQITIGDVADTANNPLTITDAEEISDGVALDGIYVDIDDFEIVPQNDDVTADNSLPRSLEDQLGEEFIAGNLALLERDEEITTQTPTGSQEVLELAVGPQDQSTEIKPPRTNSATMTEILDQLVAEDEAEAKAKANKAPADSPVNGLEVASKAEFEPMKKEVLAVGPQPDWLKETQTEQKKSLTMDELLANLEREDAARNQAGLDQTTETITSLTNDEAVTQQETTDTVETRPLTTDETIPQATNTPVGDLPDLPELASGDVINMPSVPTTTIGETTPTQTEETEGDAELA